MDLWKKYLLNTTAAHAPPDRGRAVDAIEDDQVEDDQDDQVEDDLDDEFEDDAEGDPEPEPEPAPRRRSGQPRSRAEERIEALSADKRALQARVDAADARLAALEANQGRQPQRQENADDEAARLALMSPEERITYRVERGLAQVRSDTQRVVGSLQEQTDAAAFRTLLAEKPHYKRFSAEVEKEATRLRNAGTPMPREGVLMFLVGKDAVTRADAPRTRRQSQQRMEGQETRPASGRSDVRGDRRQAGSQSQARARRLENIEI
jgi:hypothetical protein